MWTSTSHRKEEVLRARLFDPHLEKQVTELPAGRVHMVRGIARDQNHVPRADGVSAGAGDAGPADLARGFFLRIGDVTPKLSDGGAGLDEINIGAAAMRRPGTASGGVDYVIHRIVRRGVNGLVAAVCGEGGVDLRLLQ